MELNPAARGVGEVVVAELKDIAYRRGETDPRDYQPENWEQACHSEKLAGISISGGGIRSATFALGVLQALAEKGVLQKADYVSTVSGGGYIGSWLQGVLARLKSYDPLLRVVPGPPALDPITFLRKYSSYLAPRAGLSLDALVIPVIWLRNTILNQAIVVSAFLAVVLLSLWPGALLLYVTKSDTVYGVGHLAGCFLSAIGFTVIAVFSAGRTLRRIVQSEFPSARQTAVGARHSLSNDSDGVLWWVVVPTTAAAVCLLVAVASKIAESQRPLRVGVALLIVPPALHFGLQYFGGFADCYRARRSLKSSIAPLLHTLWMSMVSGWSLSLLLWGIHLLVKMWNPECVTGAHSTIAWGPPLILAAVIASVSLQIGLMGQDFPDASREWLARVGAFLVSVMAGWAVVFAVAVFAPYWIATWWLNHGRLVASGAAAWVLTTAGGVLAGKSAKTGNPEKAPATTTSKAMDLLARYGPLVAIAGFLVSVAFAAHVLLFLTVDPAGPDFLARFVGCYWSHMEFSEPDVRLGSLLLTGIAAIIVAVFSWRVNINEFSLHHFYKNRLVRSFLGASRAADGKRQADAFTGFDPGDDIPLGNLRCEAPREGKLKVPYPIVNACLNVTAGSELATQQRKSISWVFTPRFSGFVPTESDADHLPENTKGAQNAFVDTKEILGGVALGTATAISGAAANPDMGFHSSPLTAFLLTLFNVRLGWWTGNPRNARSFKRPGPLFALRWLLNELRGSVDVRSAYLNLSDGGHFENLGLYELVRRRCRYIIAINAEEDSDYTFGALGTAVRMCRADFGVEIDIDPRAIRPPDGGFSSAHFAVGRIRYPEAGSEPGYVLYLQSSITGQDEPADVEEYRREFPAFPQQSTLEQFFSEAQFESYRCLGLHVAQIALRDVTKDESLQDMFGRLTVHGSGGGSHSGGPVGTTQPNAQQK
jgi:hypothetical protein